MRIKTNERVFLAGKTSSGKTFVLRRLCSRVRRLVLLDAKSNLTDWHTEPANDYTFGKLSSGRPVRIRVVYDDDETWTNAIARAFAAGDCVIAIDEMMAVCPPGQPAPRELTAAYTRGREFGIGVWACSQRPAWVPLVAISESEHQFVFRLNLEKDRKRMAEFMGPTVERVVTDPHGFYYSAHAGEPAYYREFADVGGVSGKDGGA